MNQIDPNIALSTFLALILIALILWILSIVGAFYIELKKHVKHYRPCYSGKFGGDWKKKMYIDEQIASDLGEKMTQVPEEYLKNLRRREAEGDQAMIQLRELEVKHEKLKKSFEELRWRLEGLER